MHMFCNSEHHAHVWYDKQAISNSLSNVTKQYRVTYESDDKMFVVHKESDGKPNVSFRCMKVEYIFMIRATMN
jgi:hypothetical protein